MLIPPAMAAEKPHGTRDFSQPRIHSVRDGGLVEIRRQFLEYLVYHRVERAAADDLGVLTAPEKCS
jgi:hypothetical protein